MGTIPDPTVRIEQVGDAERQADGWRTTWRLSNLSPKPVRIRGATAPHSQFRGQESLALEVPAKDSATFALVVSVGGVTSGAIENAFLIVLVDMAEAQWRVLARLRVHVEEAGRPRARVESVTVQRVGFSGEL